MSNLDWIVIDEADTFFEVGKLKPMLEQLR